MFSSNGLCLLAPPTNTTRTIREAYDHWVSANNKATYLLVEMDDVIRTQYGKLKTTDVIIESLLLMFG